MSDPYYLCPTCLRPLPGQQRVPRVAQRAAALAWLEAHRRVWVGKEVNRYEPCKVSPAWLAIVRGLQAAGIYSVKSLPWDLRIEKLVREVQAVLKQKVA